MNKYNHDYETHNPLTNTGLPIFGETVDFNSVWYFKRGTCGGVKVKEQQSLEGFMSEPHHRSNPENEKCPLSYLPCQKPPGR